LDLASILDWLAEHRSILTWLAGGIATIAGGAWVVVRTLLDRRARAASAAPRPGGASAATTGGLAAGRDLHVGGSVTIQNTRLPRGALALAALGLVLLGVALFTGGDRIEARDSAVIGGSVTNSTIIVGPGGAQR